MISTPQHAVAFMVLAGIDRERSERIVGMGRAAFELWVQACDLWPAWVQYLETLECS